MLSHAIGPNFSVQSKSAVIVLGHSERLEVGEHWSRALDSRRLFEEIDVVTLNESARLIGRSALFEHLKTSTLFTHSAGITRIPRALQVVAINPPEPVPGIRELLKRGIAVGEDDIIAEEGAHKTGKLDLVKAGIELARKPMSTLATMFIIGRDGYSTVQQLVERPDDFPAGRAIVHSQFDGFGFNEAADKQAAADAGITVVTVEGAYHNEVLFAPNEYMDALYPYVLPV